MIKRYPSESPPIDRHLLREAYKLAKHSFDEGGLPIGAVLADGPIVVSSGYNRRMQDGDPTAHGEMDCVRRAGRRANYNKLTIYTTLSPCMMCAGMIVQFGIKRVVIGDVRNFHGNAEFLHSRGVAVVVAEDRDCIALMRQYIQANPDVWNEDIARSKGVRTIRSATAHGQRATSAR